jgi:uncharacterized protein YegL
MSASNIITDSSIELHDPNIVRDVKISTLSNGERFGLLTIQFEKAEMTKTPIFILFNIDRTGSMSEHGNFGDVNNKMHYVKETFKKITQYISRKDAEIYIKVLVFNTEVETLVDIVKVTPENCDEIVERIMSVEPEGSTAIDAALQYASTVLKEYREDNIGHDTYHIFMTDGEPTIGNKNPDDLSSMVDQDISTVFIGFGKNHNSKLLRKISEGPLSNYEFIDNIEHTSVVYGSIMHEILYTSLRNLRISVKNGQIYDWETNSWVATLREPSIVSESKKIYYIKSSDRENLAVTMFGVPIGTVNEIHLDDAFILPDLENVETGEIQHSCDTDLSKHMYRFSVQEILFQSRSIDRNMIRQLKQSIALLFRKMRRFMRLNNLLDDAMMIQLCDDLCIVYRTMGTQHGQMFSVARAASQGRQNSNTTSMSQPRDSDDTVVYDFQDSPPSMTPRSNTHVFQLSPLMRSNTVHITPLMHPVDENDDFEPVFSETDGEFETNDYIDNHMPSENPISCFATPRALHTIRSLTATLH